MAIIDKIKLPDGVTYDIQDTISGYTTNTGTVTSVVAGTGLNGGTITSSGTLSVKYGTSANTACEGNDTRLSDSRPSSDVVDTYSSTSTVPISGKGVAAALGGLGTAASKAYTTSVTSGSTDLVTSGAVYTAINNLPKPMIFKGTLGTDGTITTLPTASTSNEGYTYKVITAGTYASTAAKVGDVYVSNGSSWVLIPSGDDTVADTWRNIKVNGTEKLGTGISSGAVDFVNGTNTTVSYNATGNKISISATDTNDAVTQTATSTNSNYEVLFSGTADNTTRTEGTRKYSNFKFNPSTGTVTATKFVGDISGCTGGTVSNPIGINVDWAAVAYEAVSAEVAGGVPWSGVDETPTTLAGYGITDAKIANGVITLGSNTITPLTSSSTLNAAKLSGTIPSGCYTDTDTHRPIQVNGTQILASNTTALNLAAGSNVSLSNSSGTVTIAATDTTYESKAAASGGTDVSLCTTGEKYAWDNADTTVDQKLESTSTSSYPLLMSSDTYADTSVHYTGDVLRNNNIYANPSSGAITAIGWVNSGNGTANNAKLVRAWNENGYAGVMAGSSGAQTESLLGLMVKGVNDSEGNYLIWRAALGTSALLTTPATYIGGYNYNNQWENFIVQGRSGHFWGTIPTVTSNNGILEIGKHIDFHTTSGSTADNDYRISCTGSGAATYSGTWTKSSSIKIKENIEDMDLDEAKNIFKLRPVKFDYKKGFGQKDQRGLIAEEVAEVLPKLVVAEVGEEGTEDWCPASVDYIGVVPYLIKIVQEQQKEIEELKAKVG